MIEELKWYIDNGWSGMGISTLHAYLVLKEHGHLTRSTMAKELGISIDQAGEMINRLNRFGLVRVENEKRPFKYRAISLEN